MLLSLTVHILLFGFLILMNFRYTLSRPKQYYIDFIGKTEVVNSTNLQSFSSSKPKETEKLYETSKTPSIDKKKEYKKQIEDPDYLYTNSKALKPSMINEKSKILDTSFENKNPAVENEQQDLQTSLNSSISFGTDFPYPWYITKLRTKLYDSWQAKYIVSSNLKAVVRFNIMRDGSIEGIRIYTSSGNKIFDETAISSVYDIGRFDALPSDFNDRYLTVYVEFKSME